MAIGITLLIVGIVVVAIWVLIEVKRFKHKIFAMFLIGLILFSYFGFVVAVKGEDINFKSIDGIKTAGKLYFSWLGTVFKNTKTIVGNVIKMDWKGGNHTIGS